MTRAAATRSGIVADRARRPSRCTTARTPRSAPSVWSWNLPNGMTVASASLERRRGRPPEVAEPVAVERSGRRRRARRLAARRDRSRSGGWPRQRRPAGAVADGLVARPERPARVDPAGDRPGRLRGAAGRRAGAATPASNGVPSRRPRPSAPSRRSGVPGQRRVGVVDLGHPAGRDARRRRIVAGQVRVVGPGEPPPGGLDLGRARRPRSTPRTSWGSRLAIVPSVGRRTAAGARRGTRRRLTAGPRAVPYGAWESFAGPGSRPPSPPRRSGSPIASRSPTARAPATRAATRRGSRRPTSACRSRRRSSQSTGVDLPAWFIPARDGAPGPGRRPRPRLGVGARPDAADGRLPARGRVPLPDLRRPRPRREPARDAADQRRRVRRATRSPPSDALLARPEVTVGAISGHSMGAIGAILAAAADPRVAARRRHLRPGRSVPPDAPDVPPRPPADPRPDRLPARLADDPRLPPAARPSRRRRQRDGGDRPLRGPGAARPRRRGRRRAGRATSSGSPRPRARPRGGRPGRGAGRDARRRRRPALLAVRGPGLPAGGGPVPRRGARRAARSRTRPARSRPRRRAERIPDGESPFAAIEETPGGLRTLARVALPGRDAGRRRRDRTRTASPPIRPRPTPTAEP